MTKRCSVRAKSWLGATVMFEKGMDEVLQAIRDSLSAITNRRFYETERGFQGEFGSELRNRLKQLVMDDFLVEHEYQKTLKDHGIRIRPDLVIHIPFESSGFEARTEGNCAAIELKLRAEQEQANDDFTHLSTMCEKLGYPLGVFINVDSDQTHLTGYEGPYKERIRAFAVQLVDNEVLIHEQ